MSESIPGSNPSSVPFSPPEDVVIREAGFRHGTLCLVAGSVAGLVMVLGAGFFVMSAMNRSARLAAVVVESNPAPLAALPNESYPVAVEQETRSADPSPLVVNPETMPVIPAVTAPATITQPPAVAPKAEILPASELANPMVVVLNPPGDRMLEALGGLTAAHLYQTYLNIGLLADAGDGGVYKNGEELKFLDAVSALIDTVDNQLGRLNDSGLKVEDQKSLERIRGLTALLRGQAKELRAYWETGDKEHEKKFHRIRAEAWAGIREVLGIKE